MRKSLQKKLTGSMLVAVAAALVIVSVCLLFGMARYAEQQFETEVMTLKGKKLSAPMPDSCASAPAEAIRFGTPQRETVWRAMRTPL